MQLKPIRTEQEYRTALAQAEAFFDEPQEPAHGWPLQRAGRFRVRRATSQPRLARGLCST